MAYLNGIDISAYQSSIEISKLDTDFIIIKATEGLDYKNRYCKAWADEALKLNKKIGFYHFASYGQDPWEEALYFWKVVKDYAGKAIFVLDYEAEALKQGPEWAKKFLDRFYDFSGNRPFIYMSQSVAAGYDWSKVAKDYPLWVAAYPNTLPTKYYVPNKLKNIGSWKEETIRQYSANGKVKYYNGALDLNIFYGSKSKWNQYTKVDNEVAKGRYYQSVYPISLPIRGYFKMGDTGEKVKKLQKALNAIVKSKLAIDGIVGSNTVAAIKLFQKTYGLVIDGEFGAKSLKKYKSLKF